MKIVVPIKRVPDPYARVVPTSDSQALDTGGVKWDINAFDEIALEAAVQLRETGQDIQITIVSIGPGEAEEQLRKGLAMGADQAVLLKTTEPYDSSAAASLLAAFVQEAGADLVLMGKQSTDTDNSQVAGRLSARLDWPLISFAAKLEFVGDQLQVTRETDTGEEINLTSLPAIITADLRLAEPRYIALPGIIKARSKPLEKREVTMPTALVRTTSYVAAPSRKAGKRVGSVAELVTELKNLGVVKA